MYNPTFSIVINTLNRGPSLQKTLQSLDWLKYDGQYEVVVVNGPSTDNSAEIIENWSDRIKTGTCDIANLSVSRNIGICMAEGEIVVFIDDDAIPEPEWLQQLAVAYDAPSIGGAGGQVYDHTGYKFQYEFSTADRLANANWAAGRPTEHLCFPGSFQFPYLQGTNASFRRSALMEVGGFDEELEYYLDETELCCRLVDAGYVIRQLDKAYVHHKFAPSHVRDEFKITRYRYPVVKNKIYYSLKHGREYCSVDEISMDNIKFSEAHRADIEFHIEAGRLNVGELDVFADENARAWERGVKRGLSDQHEYITAEKQARLKSDFKPFHPIVCNDPKTIVLLCKDYPPKHLGGVAVYTFNLAQALGANGHIVHVITSSTDVNRVDFEDGTWVHRMVTEQCSQTAEAKDAKIPQHIWDWSATALKEANRIAAHRDIDVVLSPIWNCEGAAFLFDGRWPLITCLQTALSHFLESNRDLAANPEWMESFGTPMMALERKLVVESNAIWAISSAIKGEIERRYDVKLSEKRTKIIPLGLADLPASFAPSSISNETVEILFVGRLEARKGIDLLLAAAPGILERVPAAHLTIIGDDSLLIPGTSHTYRQAFEAEFESETWAKRVTFRGRVDNIDLLEAYSNCSVFVAPSRFESFGLIFLEAMRAAKPVIGVRAGGMPEIITHGKTGYLIESGDTADLVARSLQLLENKKLASNMGTAARADFESRFRSDRMAAEILNLFDIACEQFYSDRIPA